MNSMKTPKGGTWADAEVSADAQIAAAWGDAERRVKLAIESLENEPSATDVVDNATLQAQNIALLDEIHTIACEWEKSFEELHELHRAAL